MGTGTLPCEAKFGFRIHGLGKLGPAGTMYTIGKAAAAGGALNNHVDLT